MAESMSALADRFDQPRQDGEWKIGMATAAPTARRPVSVRSPLVLIVDDDDVATFVIQHTLRAEGYQTVTAGRVQDAIALLATRSPDLALLDLRLPDGSGIDICRHLQSRPGGARTPVLFMSGVQDVSTKVLAFEAGGVDYITKPMAPTELTARVRTHLRLKQAYEQLAALQAERLQRLALAQESLMAQPESVPGVSFGVARRQVLEAGGDFYDVIALGSEVVDFVVADAAGHDLAASYWVAALKTLLAEYATPTNGPDVILQQVNDALYRILPDEVFFTMTYARYQRRARRLTIANAAHPPVIVVPSSGEPTVVHREGDVVGAFPDAAYGVETLTVTPGSRLLLYTDGVTEAGHDREAGMARLVSASDAFRRWPVGEMVERVLTDTLAGVTPTDDIVVLGAEL